MMVPLQTDSPMCLLSPEYRPFVFTPNSIRTFLPSNRKKRVNSDTSSEETDFDADLGDITDSQAQFASTLKPTIRDQLKKSGTGQILLLAVWTTDDAIRKFEMFPEFVSVDDTEGTNAEERPLHDWCCKDGNNQLFPILRAFLPSTAQWVYAFVCRAAGVLFRKSNALSRVIKINSDANPQETRAISNAIGGASRKRYIVEHDGDIVLPAFKKQRRSSHETAQDFPITSLASTLVPSHSHRIFDNAQQGWCGFHRINRNFTHSVEYKSILDHERNKSVYGRIEIDIIVNWMWYFIKHYKTMEEVEMSSFLLNLYLTEQDQSQHAATLESATRSKIVEFLCKSFFIHSDMLFESCFDGRTMGEVCTSINEAWHRATKIVASGPRP